MTKQCKVCGTTDKDAEFYKGVNNCCKDCHKKAARKNRAKNIEYYRDYDKNRFQNDPRVRERHKRYQKTEAGKESMSKSRKKWMGQNPEKRAAHVILGNRIRDGKIAKPDVCEDCGDRGRLEGHHRDYSKPLDVEWLCRKCHVNRHKQHDRQIIKPGV